MSGPLLEVEDLVTSFPLRSPILRRVTGEIEAVAGVSCNDKSFDCSMMQPFVLPPWPNLRGLLNTIFFVETDADKRAFLYLDSVLFSAEA